MLSEHGCVLDVAVKSITLLEHGIDSAVPGKVICESDDVSVATVAWSFHRP